MYNFTVKIILLTHLLRNMEQVLRIKNLMHKVIILKYNRKSEVTFIKPLYYLGNVTGVTPFYDFKNNKLVSNRYGKLYGCLLMILYLYGGYKYITELQAFKLTGNLAYDY